MKLFPLNHEFVWAAAAVFQIVTNHRVSNGESPVEYGTIAGLLWVLAAVRMYVHMKLLDVPTHPMDYLLLVGGVLFTLSYNVPENLVKPLVVIGALCFLCGATFTSGAYLTSETAKMNHAVRIGAYFFMIGASCAVWGATVRDPEAANSFMVGSGYLLLTGAVIWVVKRFMAPDIPALNRANLSKDDALVE